MPRTPKNQNSEQNTQAPSLTDLVYPESTGIPVPEYLGTPDKLPDNAEDAPQPKRRGRKPNPKTKARKEPEFEQNVQADAEPEFQEKRQPVDGIAAAEKRLAEQYGVANIDAIAEPIYTGEQNYKPAESTEESAFTGESNGEIVIPQNTDAAQAPSENQGEVSADPNADPNAQQQGEAQAQNGEGQDDRQEQQVQQEQSQ